jgi:hypothetical protein
VREDGVCGVAALIRSVATGVTAPGTTEEFAVSGRTYCAWEGIQADDGRPVRVAVCVEGDRVYEIRAVGPSGAARPDAERVFRAQQKFLESLRW